MEKSNPDMTAVDYTWSSTHMDIIFPIVRNITPAFKKSIKRMKKNIQNKIRLCNIVVQLHKYCEFVTYDLNNKHQHVCGVVFYIYK
jgi:hypothetical protein